MMNNEIKNLKGLIADYVERKKVKDVNSNRPVFVKEVTEEVTRVFAPVFQQMAEQARMTKEELRSVAEDLAARINLPEINIPEIVMPKMPDITVPEPKVTVNFDASRIRIPDVIMPDEMDIKGWVKLQGVDLDHPLPVQLRDEKGRVLNLFEGFTQIVGGGGGGVAKQVRINNTSDNPVPITGTVSVSSAASTTYVIPGNSEGVVYNSDNPLPVVVSGSAGSTASALIDSSGVQYSGSNPVPVTGSLSVSGVTGSIGATILNGEGLARDSWLISDITNSVKASIIDSTGVGYSGSNPLPITWVSGTGSGATTASVIVDSTGVAYGSANGLPIRLASGTGSSMAVNISDSSGIAYSGSNPVPVLFSGTVGSSSANLIYTRQTNPTAVAADYVPSGADDLGRQLVRPVQVRDLIATAYVAVSTGTETTLLAAVAGKYHDLIYILASNNSTVAVGVDVRAVTAGNIQMHLEVPPNSVVGVSTPVPLPAMLTDGTGNEWTVDLPDITGTTVYVTALFTQEI